MHNTFIFLCPVTVLRYWKHDSTRTSLPLNDHQTQVPLKQHRGSWAGAADRGSPRPRPRRDVSTWRNGSHVALSMKERPAGRIGTSSPWRAQWCSHCGRPDRGSPSSRAPPIHRSRLWGGPTDGTAWSTRRHPGRRGRGWMEWNRGPGVLSTLHVITWRAGKSRKREASQNMNIAWSLSIGWRRRGSPYSGRLLYIKF